MDSPSNPTPGALIVGFVLLAGLGTLAIGGWAFLMPRSFAQFIGFPPYNQHLLHDVGAFQIGIGATLLLALLWNDALAVALAGFAVGGGVHTASHIVGRRLGPVTVIEGQRLSSARRLHAVERR